MRTASGQHHGAADNRLPGLDLNRLETYVQHVRPDLEAGPFDAHLITGGRSNLTFQISDAEHAWVLRRPPVAHVLSTAHDMRREFTVIHALEETAVPVPSPVLICDDDAVIGAPFYIMERVPGVPLRTVDELESLGPEATHTITTAMVDLLGDLHSIDPRDVGLEQFGRPEGYVSRQVSRWKQQLEGSRSRDLPRADALHSLLAAAVPDDAEPGIVHGDYRLDNLLVDTGTRQINAILDWEMSTLGDPLTDVALLLVYQEIAAWPLGSLISDAPKAAGYVSADEIIERYVSRSGADESRLPFHLSLAYFKLAVIIEGIYFRAQSQKSEEGGDHRELGRLVEPLLESGVAILG